MISLAEWFGDINHAISSPAYKWPQWARRAYVLTWPVAVTVRIAMIVTLILLFIVAAFVEYGVAKLKAIWLGRRDMWQ